MGGWGEARGSVAAAHGPTTGDLESIDVLLTAAGVPAGFGPTLTLLERVRRLTQSVCIVTCDRCRVTYRVVERGTPDAAAHLDAFLVAHRHGQGPALDRTVVADVRRLDVKAGDVVVAQLAVDDVEPGQLRTTVELLEALLPEGVRVVVLSRDATIRVEANAS